ncbi:hypothetical protein [Paludisphaera mucosa]|uniref:Uncharacterized protein n=1 Tax=Paludisphaera mucosa TaxID=3030827 RepID=A0ABT6FBZ7_9BACT|nr:hypothetical protein [Paludisphaera mucosa]MDG3005036.1 hypothetical protein [Paludisphaera mucosa]
MLRRTRWIMIPACLIPVAIAVAAALGAEVAEAPGGITVDEVVELWKPEIRGTRDYRAIGSSPKETPSIAGYTFRIEGPSFEDLWNHYADLCGFPKRYEAKTFQITGDVGPRGSYVVSDLPATVAPIVRGPSLFLLKTDRYTVTATISPDPDGKAVRGSIVAVTP